MPRNLNDRQISAWIDIAIDPIRSRIENRPISTGLMMELCQDLQNEVNRLTARGVIPDILIDSVSIVHDYESGDRISPVWHRRHNLEVSRSEEDISQMREREIEIHLDACFDRILDTIHGSEITLGLTDSVRTLFQLQVASLVLNNIIPNVTINRVSPVRDVLRPTPNHRLVYSWSPNGVDLPDPGVNASDEQIRTVLDEHLDRLVRTSDPFMSSQDELRSVTERMSVKVNELIQRRVLPNISVVVHRVGTTGRFGISFYRTPLGGESPQTIWGNDTRSYDRSRLRDLAIEQARRFEENNRRAMGIDPETVRTAAYGSIDDIIAGGPVPLSFDLSTLTASQKAKRDQNIERMAMPGQITGIVPNDVRVETRDDGNIDVTFTPTQTIRTIDLSSRTTSGLSFADFARERGLT